jgi:hypothetical protein
MGTQIQISRPGAFQGKQTLQELIAELAKEKEGVCVEPSIRWGRLLGLTLTVVISAGCWALIIAVLLK